MSDHITPAFDVTHSPRPTAVIAPLQDAMYAADKRKAPMPDGYFSFDERYVRLLTQGDPDTESHFVQYFSGLLRAKLKFRLRCIQDVEDVRQEVFLRVLQSLRSGPGLQHPGKLGAFVNAVCNNVVFEHIRGNSRTTQWDEAAAELRDNRTDAEHQLLSGEIREQVRIVLNQLPVKDRGLLRAIFLDERDKDDVCRDYGVQRDYLRVLLHRARRRLRDLLASGQMAGRAAARHSGGAH